MAKISVSKPVIRITLLLPLLFSISASPRAQDPDEPDPIAAASAFVEWDALRASCFVGETLDIALRFGFAARFLEERLVQLFPQHLDVPVQLDAAAFDDLDGALTLELPDAAQARLLEPGPSCVLNGAIVRATRAADRDVQGRRFVVLELRCSLVPLESGPLGTLTLSAPRMSLAHASSFRRGPFGVREPASQHDATLSGAPLVLTILPWPETNRPPEFGGAVGTFQIQAEATPRDLAADQSVRLTIIISGEGNLRHFEPPSLAELTDFHVLGRLELESVDDCRIQYDLAPRTADVSAIPSISLAYFDPTPPAHYETVSTESIPIRVRPRPAADEPRGRAPDDPARRENRASSSDRDSPQEYSLWTSAAWALGGIACAGILLFWWRRRAPGE